MSRWDKSRRKAPPLTIQASHKVRKKRRQLCIEAGATLAVIGEETPWATEIIAELISALGSLTLREAGLVLGVTKQRAAQLEARAMRRARLIMMGMGWTAEAAHRAIDGAPSVWDEIELWA